MYLIDLQRRRPSTRADQLLDELQAAVAPAERVQWNDSGHARLAVGGQLEDIRAATAARLTAIADDWAEHIAIL
jgi:hypothetical protein